MIRVISEKVVSIRKPRQCFFCFRKFDKSTQMICQVNVNDYNDGPYSVYSCKACTCVIQYFPADDHYGYPEGDVREIMNSDNFKGTPEEYLVHLISIYGYREYQKQHQFKEANS